VKVGGATSNQYNAGDSVEDLCRVCKNSRRHTVVAADSEGRILRVICDYCGSQHNYRGRESAAEPSRSSTGSRGDGGLADELVSERERRLPPMRVAESGETVDLEMTLRRIIREELGLTAVPIGERWRNGQLVLRPGKAGIQEKAWPIETFFHKIVMLRNRLRVLEQQINGAEIPEDLKLKLQAYITGCYGTLTSFNVFFAEEGDRFQGSAE
jgi:hypothetical protein